MAPDFEPLFDVGDEVRDFAEDGYQIAEFIDRGGTGEVYRLSSEIHGSSRALKLFIPFYFLNRMKNFGISGPTASPQITQQIFQHFDGLQFSDYEYRTIAQLNHPFVATVHDRTQVSLHAEARRRLKDQFGLEDGERRLYAIVAEFIDGQSLAAFAASAETKGIHTALSGVAQALDYLNLEAKVLHCDIKSENVLVRTHGSQPAIVDFGLAQAVEGDSDRLIAVATQLLPDSSYVAAAEDIRRRLLKDELVSRKEFLDAYFPWLDRYQFGLLLREVSRGAVRLPTSERAYLDLVASNLTDMNWLESHADEPIADLVERVDANRIYPLVRTGARTEDLQIPSPMRPITVPAPLKPLARHPALVRLNRQNQLGLLPATFPGARHSRYLHALDTYRLTRAFARKLLDVPRFRVEMDETSVTRLLVAALYHDINHLPFLHLFQEFGDGKKLLPDPLDLAFEYKSATSGSLEEALRDVGMSREELVLLIKSDTPLTNQDPAVSIARSILDSGLDVDKFSYLQLDAWHAGATFAAELDLAALFGAADVCPLAEAVDSYPAGALVVCYPDSAFDLVEDVVRARTEAFTSLYWCDENRAMMAAFAEAIRSIAAADGGIEKLVELVTRSIGIGDDQFLERLDDLALNEGGFRLSIAEFFDGGWSSLVKVGALTNDELLPTLARMTMSDLVDLSAGIRSEYEVLPDSDEVLLFDLPGRDLGALGGPIFLRTANGKARDARNDSRLAKYADELRSLSGTISLFGSVSVAERAGRDDDERGQFLRSAIRKAMRRDNYG